VKRHFLTDFDEGCVGGLCLLLEDDNPQCGFMFYLFFFADVTGSFLLNDLFLCPLYPNTSFSSTISISFLSSFCKLLHSFSTIPERVLFFAADFLEWLFSCRQDS
jgi:hypothetical protein